MEKINVTKTFLPPLGKIEESLAGIWETGQVANYGPLVRKLEEALAEYLGVKHVVAVTNGTIALQLAYRATHLSGEVITTPFSYVATTSSLVWEGLTPVFADIDAKMLTINPGEIEKAITKKTSAIVATHVYGHPCEVEAIGEIGRNHNLQVIYDAAHAFGVRLNGRTILDYGDMSILSFHATKLMHSGEGGAVVTNDDTIAYKLRYLRNFGHETQESFQGLGINGKMSELHAAMGLGVLPYVEENIRKRKAVVQQYDKLLSPLALTRPLLADDVEYNFSYFPVIFETEAILLKVKSALEAQNIFPRRYFYPSLSTLPYLPSQAMPVSEDIASRVVCLPLWESIDPSVVEKICTIVSKNA